MTAYKTTDQIPEIVGLTAALQQPAANLGNLHNLFGRALRMKNGTTDQLTIMLAGDSFGDRRAKYIFGTLYESGVTPLMARMLGVSQGVDGWMETITYTGGAAYYSPWRVYPQYWPAGNFWTLPSGGQIKAGQAGVAHPGNEFAIYPIKDSGSSAAHPSGGTLDVKLLASDYSTVLSSITGYSTNGSLSAAKVGWFIVDATLAGLLSGDTYTLSYCGHTTAAITYSSTPATNVTRIGAALSAMTVGASLSGKVVVSNPTGSTYRIIVTCAGNGTVPSRPSISYAAVTGTGTATFAPVSCWVQITGTGGTCSLVPVVLGMNRVQSLTAVLHFNFWGTPMQWQIGVNQQILNTVLGDAAPDLFTIDQYAGQIDSQATLESYYTMIRAALPATQTDILHVGFAPTQPTSDSITTARATAGRAAAPKFGALYYDSMVIFPTWASIVAVDAGTTLFTGDNTHHGEAYNQMQAGAIARWLGLDWIIGGLSYQSVNASTALVRDTLSLGAKDTPALTMTPDNVFGGETLIKTQGHLEIVDSDGNPIARFSADDGRGQNFYAGGLCPYGADGIGLRNVGGIYVGVARGDYVFSYAGFIAGELQARGQITLSDADFTAPVNIKPCVGVPTDTAVNGSLRIRTDGAGGLYQRISGAWVAK